MHVSSPVMLKLKKATPADAAAITLLANHIWRIHYPPIIGSEQVEFMLANMHTPANVEEQMERGQSFFMIMNEENVIGYVATSIPTPGELFIHKFYIDPKEQGKGYGQIVFNEILQLNPEANRIRLTVNRMNYKSINFYYKIGFIIEEVKDFDIGGGYFMNDFIMKYESRK